jgi:hypothetical protein
VRGIAIEEMLHMALVANLMSAIGAAPNFGRPNFPQRSGYFPAEVRLDLLPFGEQALDHFLFLERPEGMQRDDGSEFVETASPRDPVDPRETLPRGQKYVTIGHLYRGIADGLRNLSSRLGERAVFVGSPHVQATPELFRWPQLVSVTDLESALVAVEEIIEQGEGALGDWETAHYGRFLSIRREFDAMLRADPTFEPARPALAAFLRQPFDIPTAQPLITDVEARRIAELAGLTYELILGVLLRVFTHTDESNAQLGTLLDAALALMAKVLQPLGTALTTLPAGSSYPGRTTGFAFEMHYVLGNMTPHREPAWALLAERGRMLAHRCSQVAAEPSHHADLPAVTGEAAAHAHAIADALTAQVPAELRPEPGQAIRL